MPDTQPEVQKAPYPLLECHICMGHGYIRGPLDDAKCPGRNCRAGRIWERLQRTFHWPLDLQYDIVRIQRYKQWKRGLFDNMRQQLEAQTAQEQEQEQESDGTV